MAVVVDSCERPLALEAEDGPAVVEEAAEEDVEALVVACVFAGT